MTEHDALVALTVLHREGHYQEQDEYGYAENVTPCCMTCPNSVGWPCETRQIIDQALGGTK
jgi:hypothetical protein